MDEIPADSNSIPEYVDVAARRDYLRSRWLNHHGSDAVIRDRVKRLIDRDDGKEALWDPLVDELVRESAVSRERTEVAILNRLRPVGSHVRLLSTSGTPVVPVTSAPAVLVNPEVSQPEPMDAFATHRDIVEVLRVFENKITNMVANMTVGNTAASVTRQLDSFRASSPIRSCAIVTIPSYFSTIQSMAGPMGGLGAMTRTVNSCETQMSVAPPVGTTSASNVHVNWPVEANQGQGLTQRHRQRRQQDHNNDSDSSGRQS